MKIGLEIKNGSKVFKPKKDDVIIFDGKDWYVTTKNDIFEEYQNKVDAKLQAVQEALESIAEYKAQVSAQMVELSTIIRNFIRTQGE